MTEQLSSSSGFESQEELGVLPIGWEWCKLGEIAKYINGRAFKPTDWETEGLPIIRIQNLTDPTADFNYYSKPVEKQYYVESGDLLISWSATLDTFLWTRGRAILNQHIFRVEEDKNLVDKKYLHYVVRAYLHTLKSKAHGTSMQHITRGPFESTEIPLPPLPEQHRIVEHIEAFTQRMEEIQILRSEAVEAMNSWMLAELNTVFEDLAAEYSTQSLDELFTFRNDVLHPSDKPKGIVRFVGLQHVESNTGRKIGEVILQAEQLEGRKFRFSPGEIVYGYLRPYLNKVWIADCEGLCSVDQYVLKPDRSLIETTYLAYAMRSPYFLSQSKELTGVLMLPRLRSGLLKQIEIPLPPLTEQHRIVAKLDRLQAKAESIRTAQAETQKELDALLPAVLDRAFRGEL